MSISSTGERCRIGLFIRNVFWVADGEGGGDGRLLKLGQTTAPPWRVWPAMGLPQVRQCGFRRGLAVILSWVVGAVEILWVDGDELEILMLPNWLRHMRRVSYALRFGESGTYRLFSQM